jgi:hypothetical protein
MPGSEGAVAGRYRLSSQLVATLKAALDQQGPGKVGCGLGVKITP